MSANRYSSLTRRDMLRRTALASGAVLIPEWTLAFLGQPAAATD